MSKYFLLLQFESEEECEAVCVEDSDAEITRAINLIDKCNLPIKPGPCAGNFSRYELNYIFQEYVIVL